MEVRQFDALELKWLFISGTATASEALRWALDRGPVQSYRAKWNFPIRTLWRESNNFISLRLGSEMDGGI